MTPLCANRLEEVRRCFDGRIIVWEDRGDSIVVAMFPSVWVKKLARAYETGDLGEIEADVAEASDEDWAPLTKPHLLLIDPARMYVGPAN